MRMRTVSSLVLTLLVFGTTTLACVGDSPDPGGEGTSSGAATSSGGSSGAPSGSSSGESSSGASSSGTVLTDGGSSSSGGASSSSSGSSGSSGSSSGEPDAAVACIEHAALRDEANLRCRANRSSATGGGIIQPGVYRYTGRWNCDSNTRYIIGSATVIDDGGTLRMRYRYRHNPETGLGAETVGTWTLAPDTVNGTLRRTEECRVPNIGAFEDASAYEYDVASGVLTLRFAGYDEAWSRQQ